MAMNSNNISEMYIKFTTDRGDAISCQSAKGLLGKVYIDFQCWPLNCHCYVGSWHEKNKDKDDGGLALVPQGGPTFFSLAVRFTPQASM